MPRSILARLGPAWALAVLLLAAAVAATASSLLRQPDPASPPALAAGAVQRGSLLRPHCRPVSAVA
jgi:hypothetical protein